MVQGIRRVRRGFHRLRSEGGADEARMRISSEHIEKLRSYGLFVAKPRSSDSCYPDGVLVGKPDNVLGNHIEAYSAGYSTAVAVGQEVRFDAPPVWFFGHHGVWFVLAEDYCPGPGPGDFLDE